MENISHKTKKQNITVLNNFLQPISRTTTEVATGLLKNKKAFKLNETSIVIFFHKNQRKKLKKELELIDNTCYICGCTGENLTLDHVTPKHLEGGDEDVNLRLACSRCNEAKKYLTIDNFIRKIKSNRREFKYISNERIGYLEKTYFNKERYTNFK